MIELTSENFTENTAKLTIIDFLANWCGMCKVLAPQIDKLAKVYPQVNFCKVDVDKEKGIADKFGVVTLPTIILMSDGVEIERVSSVVNVKKIEDMIKKETTKCITSDTF